MTTAHLLISCRQMQADLHRHEARLAALGITYDCPPIDQQLSEAQLLDIIDRYDGIIAGDDEITAKVLAQGVPRLRAVSKWGVGVDGIDLEAARELGIPVTNTPGAFDDDVADVAIGYLILLLRGLHLIDRAVRAGDWHKIEGTSASSRTLGVIGLGGIGRAVARRGITMGMRVFGADPHGPSRSLAGEQGVEVRALDDLLRDADVVSLNCPLTPETFHLLGERELALLPRGSFVINTSRGRTIDQPALVRALESGHLAGAALDVFESEPIAADDPLLRFANVVVGSHNASNTRQAVEATSQRALDNLLAALGLA